ncbi:MAG: HemK family protein methyltransferase [Patescibacteria group bacterium]
MKMMSEPEAYRIGSIPFIHTEIYLDSHPLIPRTETEYWVDLAIKEIKTSGIQNPKVLDLCAGSGCIGVAVLKEIPEALVDFAEIDEAHHLTIQKNIVENQLDATHTRILGGDLFENITDQYDFILSNPPYIDPALKERVGESVKQYEPEKALYGGEKGLEIINRILAQLPSYLKPGGFLCLEHEPEQVEALSKHPLYLESEEDQFGVLRFSKFRY